MSIQFVRRRNLGRGSVLGMKRHLKDMQVVVSTLKTWTGRVYGDKSPPQIAVRWGCTSTLDVPSTTTVINTADAIHRVNDKRGFRVYLDNLELCPETVTLVPEAAFVNKFPMVVRTAKHAQGRNLWVVNSLEELSSVVQPLGEDNWYASELIDKESEYRVYVVNGRVATVAKKTPADPSAVAWNVAQGGRFDVVSWGDWPLEVCRVAIEAFRHSGLDFGGVDVMVEKETNRPYVIEINSAPSLPKLSDGQPSYRQLCMAKCFKYILEEGNDWIEPTGYDNWRGSVHPAIWCEN